jgi:hypothetical protein
LFEECNRVSRGPTGRQVHVPVRDYTDLPALAFRTDRALVAFVLRSDTAWSLKDTLVFPW